MIRSFSLAVAVASVLFCTSHIAAQPLKEEPAVTTIQLHPDKAEQVISKHIYGHFAEHLGRCVYGGLWVGEKSSIPNIKGFRKDVVDALKALSIPNLRWPGGCFADDYHWRDGIGPRENRPKTVNIHWGDYVEDNSFGTHEFLDLCELLNTEPYVAMNLGSSTPAEMRSWIEYITFAGDSMLANERRKNGRDKPWKLTYVGIGNENWGCGGNMTAEHYTNEYNRFAVFARDFSGNKLVRVACGPNSDDANWAEVVLDKGRHVNGISWHYYTLTGTWAYKGSATKFDEDQWHETMFKALHLENLLQQGDAIFDKKDPENRIGIFFDEWGTWWRTEKGDTALYQQNTMRDALVAGVSLNIFNAHAKRVRMANIAQTVNVLQSMILTEDGGQNRMLLTPTYHVFEMYKVHMDAKFVPIKLKCAADTRGGKTIPLASASASIDASGNLNITLCNLHATQQQNVEIDFGAFSGTNVSARTLAGDSMSDHNTFDEPNRVTIQELKDAKIDAGKLKITLPAHSVSAVSVRK